jgi:hypothetical protein
VLAAAGVLAWTIPSRAGDIVRLNRTDNTPTQQLVDDGRGADTIAAHHHWGWGGYRGFGWGGYRGFGLGGYRGFGWGGYGSFYRPYYGYGSFYRPYYGYGLGMGYGLGYGLGYGYGGYYPGFRYSYYGGYFPGFFGCSGVTGSIYTLASPANVAAGPVAGGLQPGYVDVNPPRVQPQDGTYPYDGGPASPVPDPKAAPAPPATPQRTVPLEGRSVSLPKPASKWAYPAYGETARRTPRDGDRTLLTKGTPTHRSR